MKDSWSSRLEVERKKKWKIIIKIISACLFWVFYENYNNVKIDEKFLLENRKKEKQTEKWIKHKQINHQHTFPI